MTLRRGFLLSIALICFGFFSACSSDSASNTCTTDATCALGTVCSVDSTCISAACEFCTETQICYKPTPDSPGSCSAPECASDADCETGSCAGGICGGGGDCSSDADCAADEKCNLADKCVKKEGGGDCTDNIDCGSEEFCNPDGDCVAGCRDNDACPEGQVCGNGECACGAGTCPDGKVCLDSGNCGDATDCTQVICDPAVEVCDPGTLACVARCMAGSCNANEACNAQTGFCEVTNCPNEDPLQCDANVQRPIWDPIKCFCAECTADTDCDAGLGETCNQGGQCFVCQTTCDPVSPIPTCGAGTPYCINDCCVTCVGAADCEAGELCLDGTCGPPPNCSVDPTVCPVGFTCNMGTGQCDAPNNTACDPANPASCPNGGFCDPGSMTCTNPFGGGDCGFCPGQVVNNVCEDACPGTTRDANGNILVSDCQDSGFIKTCGCDGDIAVQFACLAIPTGPGCCPNGGICLGGSCLDFGF